MKQRTRFYTALFFFSIFSIQKSVTEPLHEAPQPSSRRRSSSVVKPTLLYLVSNKDGDLNKSRKYELERLSKCGFDVREFVVKSAEVTGSQIKSGAFPHDTPIFISATHGAGTKEGGNSGLFVFDPGGYKVSGPALLSEIRRALPNSPILVGSCHAGLCRDGKCSGLGTTCSSHQTSIGLYDVFPVEEALTDLWCDSIGKCGTWEAADQNKDGKLDGDEINLFLSALFEKKGIGGGTSITNGTERFLTWKEIEPSKSKCESKGFEFSCATNLESFDLKISERSRERGWVKKSKSQNINLESRELHPGDFRDFYAGGKQKKYEFDITVKTLLDGKWPPKAHPLTRETVGFLLESYGEELDFDDYSLSEDGRELSFNNIWGEERTLRLDGFRMNAKSTPIECECVTKNKIPFVKPAVQKQEVVFDSSYVIPCRAK